MPEPEALALEIKKLIIDALVLEDISVAEIETDAPLFVEGLGLDSIDALELALALEERYGVTIEEDPEKNQELFASVRRLAEFVAASRTDSTR